MSKINFGVDHSPGSEDNVFLRKKIVDFNAQFLHEQATQFNVYAKTEKNDIIGGATIWEHSDALYIDILWVDEHYRNQKIGSKLITEIIAQARKKNIKKLFVDTYDFQASDFYLKHGFFVIGRLEKYLLEHDRIYFRMNLD